jgi:hypothetical protein
MVFFTLSQNNHKVSFSTLENKFIAFKADKNVKTFRAHQSESEKNFKSVIESLLTISNETKKFDLKFASEVVKFSAILEERNKSVLEIHMKVVTFLTTDNNDPSSRTVLTKMMHDHAEKMLKFKASLDGHLSDLQVK